MSIVVNRDGKKGEFIRQNTNKTVFKTNNAILSIIPEKANLALHRAVWQNDRKNVMRIINKIDPDVIELESGWTALHKALYLGNIRIASILVANGASYEKRDRKNRTPLDLISRELKMPDENNCDTEVYGYGCGSNYQLGIGNNEDANEIKCLTVLSDKSICDISVSKYHGMALTRDGDVYSWGWNRGGRLGHPELETNKIGEGLGVQLFPKLVSLLTKTRIVNISAAKNHSLAVTNMGEVYSWGSDRDGKLGYLLSGKHRKIPRKINILKSIFVTKAVAANRHSVVITDTGSVYTWGSNKYGQLGYGTSDSVSNHKPCLVEAIRHKKVIHISASKRHTIAVMTDGEVFTWGNKCVAPRQIILAGCRDKYMKTSIGREIYIHRGNAKTKKPLAVMAAAGVQRSFCLTSTGTVLYWDNNNNNNDIVKEIKGNLRDKKIIWISASKTYFGLCTNMGDAYIIDNQEFDVDVQMKTVEKMKNCAKVITGERHYMFLQNWDTSYLKHLSEKGSVTNQSNSIKSVREDNSENVSESALSISLSNEMSITRDYMKIPFEIDLDLIDSNNFELIMSQSEKASDFQKNVSLKGVSSSMTLEVASLRRICEKTVSVSLLRPSNVLYIYQLADNANLTYLKRNCLRMVISNLALVLNVMENEISNISQNVLYEIEKKYKKSILGMTLNEAHEQLPWYFAKAENNEILISNEYGSRPTSYPTLMQIEHDEDFEVFEVTSTSDQSQTGKVQNKFRPDHNLPDFIEIEKIKNSMVRKLEQIEILIKKESEGLYLDNHQIDKIKKKTCFKNVLNAIALGSDLNTIKMILETGHEIKDNEGIASLSSKSKKKKKKKNELSDQKISKIHSKKKSISQDDESYLKPWKNQITIINTNENLNTTSSQMKKTLTEDEFPKIETIKENPKLKTKNEIKNQDIKRGALVLTKDQIKPIKSISNTKKSKNIAKKTSLKDLLTKTPEEIRKSIENTQETTPVQPPLPISVPVPVWGKTSKSKEQNKTQMMSILDIQEEEELSKCGMVPLIRKKEEEEEINKGGARRPANVKMDPKSKWYVPNAVLVQSIPALQVEEKAMEEISNLYGPNVKIRVVEGTARGTFKHA